MNPTEPRRVRHVSEEDDGETPEHDRETVGPSWRFWGPRAPWMFRGTECSDPLSESRPEALPRLRGTCEKPLGTRFGGGVDAILGCCGKGRLHRRCAQCNREGIMYPLRTDAAIGRESQLQARKSCIIEKVPV